MVSSPPPSSIRACRRCWCRTYSYSHCTRVWWLRTHGGRAVIAGEITLQQAKAYGRDLDRHGNPVKSETPKKATKKTTEPTLTPCLCGCGTMVPRTFAAGHDMVMFRVAREHLTEGREITDAQREYLESSGKMQRVKDKLAKDEAKRQEKIRAKAETQRKREGEAEAKKRNATD